VVTGSTHDEADLAAPWRGQGELSRAGGAPLEGRRVDAGSVRLTERDIRGLVWCGEMYGVRTDLFAKLLGVSGDVVRQWRHLTAIERSLPFRCPARELSFTAYDLDDDTMVRVWPDGSVEML